jgi:O-antigen ligase/tetratricopeptide (TPR) repeat protein
MSRHLQQVLDRLLLHVVDGSLAGVFLLVPVLMGGRHAVGQLVLTVLAVSAGSAWALRQCLREDAAWRPTLATPLLVAGLTLVVLQVMPLPPGLLAWLAPGNADLLSLWKADGAAPAGFGRWPFISLTPAETQAGLVLLLDYVLLFYVAVQRILQIEDVERLLRWCALATVGMAALAIVQLLAGNGKFLWFYQHPTSGTADVAKGCFANRNHFAQFLALGIGPLIWWLQDAASRVRSRRGPRDPSASPGKDLTTYLLALALGIVLFAGLLSLSRGGTVVILLAVAITTVGCYRAHAVSGRFVAVLGGIGLLIGVSLTIFGLEHVSDRLDDLSSGSLERMDHESGRRTIWMAAARAIPHHLLIGAGVGSFAEVYPLYTNIPLDDNNKFTHAENSYLQVGVETGALGLALVVAGLLLCAWWCVGGLQPSNPQRVRVCAAAIAGSIAATAAHACVDFIWYVPACVAITSILAACAMCVNQQSQKERATNKEERSASPTRRSQSRGESSVFSEGSLARLPSFQAASPVTRSSPLLARCGWSAAAVAILGLGGWMIANRVGPAAAQPSWDDYLVAWYSVPRSAFNDKDVQLQWVGWLENALRWEPTHLQAHLALAECHRRLFDTLQAEAENQMSLANIRDAAIQSHFASHEALAAWLARAIGPHWVHLEHALCRARQAVALSPLQGRGYIYLADLSFLCGGQQAGKRSCIEQALNVRPFDGEVLYAAGREALLAGDARRWLEYSQRAFQTGIEQQQRLIADLAASTPNAGLPALADFVIRQFQPDVNAVRYLHVTCAKRCPPEQIVALTRYRVQLVEHEAAGLKDHAAAALWMEAQQLNGALGNEATALRCSRNAVQCDANDFNAHFTLGQCLLTAQSFDEADSHFRWCLQRSPGNVAVEAKLRETLRMRLDSGRRAAAATDPLR